jgi:hypothetical protein
VNKRQFSESDKSIGDNDFAADRCSLFAATNRFTDQKVTLAMNQARCHA